MPGQCHELVVTCLLLALLLRFSSGMAEFATASPFSKAVCKPIPRSLKLCQDLAYHEMRLPNLLNHETMDEVQQQARSWVPLLPKQCHPDLQLLLCSLFAPVCVPNAPGPIYPCRSLCESVRNACGPVMERAGYPWPRMLICDQYPQNDMCINVQCKVNCSVEDPRDDAPNMNGAIRYNTSTNASGPGAPSTCSPCDNPLDKETVLDHFCASEFVLKVKIRSVKGTRKDLKIYTEKRRRVIYKQGPLRKKELRRLTLVIQDGVECPCPQLKNKKSDKKGKKKKSKDFYLIMGRKLERKLLVTVLHHWPKKQRVLKKLSKKFTEETCFKK